MEENYAVSMGNKQAGKVQVIRQGLYYRIICRCLLTGEVMYRLFAVCGENKENLGIVVPMDDGFGLDTRIPVKRLGEGAKEFCLIPKLEHSGKFVPIYPEEPFAYIQNLKDGFLTIQSGKIGMFV